MILKGAQVSSALLSLLTLSLKSPSYIVTADSEAETLATSILHEQRPTRPPEVPSSLRVSVRPVSAPRLSVGAPRAEASSGRLCRSAEERGAVLRDSRVLRGLSAFRAAWAKVPRSTSLGSAQAGAHV